MLHAYIHNEVSLMGKKKTDRAFLCRQRIADGETYEQFTARSFWTKVEKTDGCWLWKAGVRDKKSRDTYGQFFHGGRNVSAHRMAMMLEGSMLGPNDVVAHRCDNPRCVRPDHLFITTSAGNTADREMKNRGAKKERNGNAFLDDQKVAELRADAERGALYNDLADKYGISRIQVWRLVTRRQRDDGKRPVIIETLARAGHRKPRRKEQRPSR
jgi:hypothetical protein